MSLSSRLNVCIHVVPIPRSATPRDAQQASAPIRLLIAALTVVGVCGPNSFAFAADEPSRLVELTDGTVSWTGRIMARNSGSCFVMGRNGTLAEVPIPTLQSFKVIADEFQPLPPGDFRKLLLAEFPNGYEVQTSGNYIVCAAKGRARPIAELFDDIRRQITTFYKVRGFETEELSVPLLAVVLKTRDEFHTYCNRDGMAWTDTLRGYYSLKSNRVVLFDDESPLIPASHATPMSTNLEPLKEHQMAGQIPVLPFGREAYHVAHTEHLALRAMISGETTNTIVHEATHQVSFNLGIHSRIGETPMWLLEGLATTLEAPGLRTRDKQASGQVNSDRLAWFQGEAAEHRQRGDLARMIASDELFQSRTLDAYSEAWALAFFLSENPARARQFMKYIQLVSNRSPFEPYTAELRLSDFQSVFGADLSRLEVDMLRRIDDVAVK